MWLLEKYGHLNDRLMPNKYAAPHKSLACIQVILSDGNKIFVFVENAEE